MHCRISICSGRGHIAAAIYSSKGGEDDVLKKDESNLDGLTTLALFLIARLKGR